MRSGSREHKYSSGAFDVIVKAKTKCNTISFVASPQLVEVK